MEIKFPKAEQLKKQAFKYNRKAFKKVVIGYIKSLGNVVKLQAKAGHREYFKTFTENYTYGSEMFLAARWYRRYSGLKVELTERTCESNKKKRYIDEMDVRIKW